jgi:type I restriction enzyme M protein
MAKQVKEKSIEESLWQACDKLRGSVESSEYKTHLPTPFEQWSIF